MNPLPEFLEPTSEFEMWREYRDKRNRRAFYYLLLLLILLIIAYALPSTTGPVFGTGDTSSTSANPTPEPGLPGADGEDGEDGRDGLNGRNGRDGQDGQDGAQGEPGPAGPAGPAGSGGVSAPAPSASPGTSVGQGVLRVGTCDDDITTSLRSRLVGGTFYFRQITLSNIAADCIGKDLDVYLLDVSSNELATVFDQALTGSSITISYADFSTPSVLASAIDSIALEIRD